MPWADRVRNETAQPVVLQPGNWFEIPERNSIMSVITTRTLAVVPPLPIRRFTVDEYHPVVQAGVLGKE